MTKNTIRNISDKIKITDWKYLEQMNANDTYTEFENALNNIINGIAPEKTIKIPSSIAIRDPWMTRGLVTSSRTLIKLHKKKIGKHKSHQNFN